MTPGRGCFRVMPRAFRLFRASTGWHYPSTCNRALCINPSRPRPAVMQVLASYPGTPESYVQAGAERKMPPPSPCPNCGCHRRLRLLGYYERFVSATSGRLFRMKVRRFRCRDCRLTVSLLPDFCVSYRLIRGEVAARFLRGDGIEAPDLPWQALLVSCRKKYAAWLPEFRELLYSEFGVRCAGFPPHAVWIVLEARFGHWMNARFQLLAKCGVTLLGRYRCHATGFNVQEDDHTLLAFSSGTDPPN